MRQFPWPQTDLEISPTQFEIIVRDWIENTDHQLASLDVLHNQNIEADDGTYQIDVIAKFEAFGADFIVIIECKKHKNNIPRSMVQILKDKVSSIGAHKGMLFATTGFQSGAITYAEKHGIALIKITDGMANYETRSIEKSTVLPDLNNSPKFMGWFVSSRQDEGSNISAIDFRNKDIFDFIEAGPNR